VVQVGRSNDDVARMLEEFAELLAISGGDPFKVRAYEKAARAVAGYHLDVANLDAKQLDEIPSVGAHLAAKVVEFRTTGSVDELDDLRARVPAGLRTLLSVPGLGPKRARQVYDELGIASLTELLDALHDHRLQDLRGWGEKSEENLARALAEAQTSGGRIQLAVALDLAEEMVTVLSSVRGVRRATYAGSVRRMRDTIGDIDLLVAAQDAGPVMDAFTQMPLVARVQAKGPTKSSVVTATGVQVDLRVVDPSQWGAALMYFTGSKAHNIRIRDIAVRTGLKLSEYGLFEVDTGALVVAEREEDVYERLGLPWIHPTLREDTGEVEAALEGRLPHLVELRDIRGDLHTHTNLTDGVATLEEMVATAKRRGYRYYAVTDHAPLLHMQRMTAEKAIEQRRRLRELERTAGLALLHGTELNIQPDGSVDWDDDFLAGFDIVVASVHSAFRLSRDEMTARILRAVEHPHINVIGHPTGRTIGHRPPMDADWDEIFRAAARTGTALEINGYPDRLDLDDGLVRRARHAGVHFAISTDAHAVPHLDYLRFGVATAQRGWSERGDVINTYPLGKLKRFLAKRAPAGARQR
jgi:DNA polymerase (family 10)